MRWGQRVSRTAKLSLGLGLLVAVLAVATVGAASAFDGDSVTVDSERPSECTAIAGGERQQFDFVVDYDLGNKDPDRISVQVKEEPYGEPTREIDISDRSSVDTVDVSVEEYIDPDWESVTVKVAVWADGETKATGTEELYYPVSGSGWECDPDPERINGHVDDGDGSDPPPGIVVVQRLSDKEDEFVEYRTDDDCPGCFSLEDQEFLDAGEYRIHVYGSDNGYPPYWGYVDIRLEEGESEYVSFDRGGVFATELQVSDRTGSTTDLRFGPGEEIKTELDVQKSRHGRNVEIEVYTFDAGGERGENPDAVYDPSRLDDGPNSYDFTFDAPANEGRYEVEYLVVTEFDDEGELITDEVTGPTFEVKEYEPPRIDGYSPDDPTPSVGTDGALEFVVDVSDSDTSQEELSVEWYADEKKVGEGSDFVFDGSEYDGEEVLLEVIVSDDTSETENAIEAWTIELIDPPVVDEIEPDVSTVDVGEEIEFVARASDPGDNTPLSYTWEIENEVYTGSGITHAFDSVGKHDVRLTVENTRGIAVERAFTMKTRNVEPKLEPETPSTGSIDATTGSTTQFTGTVENYDSTPVTVWLTVDGDVVEETDVDSDRETLTFDHKFDSPGTKRVEMLAEDGHGEKNRTVWDVNVAGRPPTIDEWSPESSTVSDIISGETVTFDAVASDPDGGSIKYRWYVDDEYKSSGETFEPQFQEHGQYTVRVTAVDDTGQKTDREWGVSVSSFRVSPRIDAQVSATELVVEESTELSTVSFGNPEANDRTGYVEIVLSPPDGVDVSTTMNVLDGDPTNFKSFETVEPGESTSATISLSADESLAGDTITVDYQVIYYPEGNPDDYTIEENQTIELPVHSADGASDDANSSTEGDDERESTDSDSTTGSSDVENESTNGGNDAEDEDEDGLPRFTSIGAVLGIISLLFIRRTLSR